MNSVTIQQVMVIARQESAELKHFYIGVEHLLLALTRLKGGVTTEVLDQRGVLGYVLNLLNRDMFGRGDEQRYWPDFRNTDRVEKILDNAHDLIDQGLYPEDRALFMAILDEGDNLPVRIFQELGIDTAALRDSVLSWTGGSRVSAPSVPITVEDPALQLNGDQEKVLREMFPDAGLITVKRALQDGYSGAAVLLVQPTRHKLVYAPVVVKLDDRQSIQYEKLRYDQWVKDILPPTSARIVDEPVILPELTLGGLKYTFVHKQGTDAPVNLREYAAQYGAQNLAEFIHTALYEAFRPYWWGQRQAYHFQVWQEYELLLPPALILEALPPSAATATTRTLHPKGAWSFKGGVPVGEIVILEGFVAQKVKIEQRSLQVSAGAQAGAADRASRIEVRGIDTAHTSYFRGQTIKRLVGRVLRTRDDTLQEQVQALEPNFDILAQALSDPTGKLSLPNPLLHYARLLERWIDGTLSPIHGDLHTGNILIGPAGDAWLIDFEWTRQGHTLFDWAVLEISLLAELLVPLLEDNWDSCWGAIYFLHTLSHHGSIPEDTPSAVLDALRAIRAVRAVAEELLAPNALWSEYYIALAMCAIRVPSWKNRSLTTRRFMFLVSALSMDLARTNNPLDIDIDTIKTATDLRHTSA